MTKRSAPRAAVVPALLAIAVTASVASCAAIAADRGATRPAGAARAGHSSSAPLARTPAPAGVTVRHFALPDGHRLTAARFTGAVRFVLHCGSMDPGPPCQGKAAGPALSPAERRFVIGAFNGGFKLSAHAGGYEQGGAVLSPLVPGRASLVIYRSGAASIGTWGHGMPQPGKPVYSVRQNLVLLVSHGRPTAASARGWGSWGSTITGAADTARSALGESAGGQLIYVASMSATPGDLAAALVRAGAAIGMELDINPEWVQLAYALGPGGPLRKGISGQVRPASQYVRGWTRDFIAVLAKWPPSPAPGVRVVP